MPIASSDILLKYSTKAGAAGNSEAGTADASLGKYISTTEIVFATLHNLFDIVTGDENAALDEEYRCIFIHNAHATLTYLNVRVFIVAETPDGSNIEIGVDPTGVTALASAAAQAEEIVDEDTAPAGVAFSAPVVLENALAVGELDPGEVAAIWVKRVATDSDALAADSATIRVIGDSL